MRRSSIGLGLTLTSSAGVTEPGGVLGVLLPERWRAHAFGALLWWVFTGDG